MKVRGRIVVVALAAVLVVAGAACAPGTPDRGYSPSGAVAYGPGIGGAGATLRLLARADGAVIANMSSARPLTLIGADGVVDAAWGSTLPNSCRRSARLIATGTSVLFTCSHLISSTEGEAWQIWRVTADGHLDPGFGGGDGIVDAPADLDEFDVVPLPTGGYLGLGHAATVPSTTSVPPLVAIVYSANGTATSTTPINIPVDALPDGFSGWTLTSDLTPTVHGVAAREEVSATLTANGLVLGLSRTQHFDASGAIVDSPPFAGPPNNEIGRDHITGLVELPDGRTASISTMRTVDVQLRHVTEGSFLRMHRADGSPDPAFGVAGNVDLRIASGNQLEPSGIAVTNGGRLLVVVGSIGGSQPVVARYDATTGALDATFGDHGSFPVFLASVATVVVRPDADQVYVGGFDANARPAVSRIWNHTTS